MAILNRSYELKNLISTRQGLNDSIEGFAAGIQDGERGKFVCIFNADPIWHIQVRLEKNASGKEWDHEVTYEFTGKVEEKSREQSSFCPYSKQNQAATALKSRIRLVFQRMDQMHHGEIDLSSGKENNATFIIGSPMTGLEDGTKLSVYLTNHFIE